MVHGNGGSNKRGCDAPILPKIPLIPVSISEIRSLLSRSFQKMPEVHSMMGPYSLFVTIGYVMQVGFTDHFIDPNRYSQSVSSSSSSTSSAEVNPKGRYMYASCLACKASQKTNLPACVKCGYPGEPKLSYMVPVTIGDGFGGYTRCQSFDVGAALFGYKPEMELANIISLYEDQEDDASSLSSSSSSSSTSRSTAGGGKIDYQSSQLFYSSLSPSIRKQFIFLMSLSRKNDKTNNHDMILHGIWPCSPTDACVDDWLTFFDSRRTSV